MNEVPSLATIRPMLSPSVLRWVESVLVGETSTAFGARLGINAAHMRYPQYVAEAAGLVIGGANGIREAVLRMRIRELEER